MEKITLEQINDIVKQIKPIPIRAEFSKDYYKKIQSNVPMVSDSSLFGTSAFTGLRFEVNDEIDCNCKIIYSDGTEKIIE